MAQREPEPSRERGRAAPRMRRLEITLIILAAAMSSLLLSTSHPGTLPATRAPIVRPAPASAAPTQTSTPEPTPTPLVRSSLGNASQVSVAQTLGIAALVRLDASSSAPGD